MTSKLGDRRTGRRELTPKQRRFATALLETGSPTAAYRAAYNATAMSSGAIAVEARRLQDHPKIALLLKAGRERAAAQFDITIDCIVTMLLADREYARQHGNASAAIAATKGLAKVTGHTVDDRRRNERKPLQDFGTDQLLALEQLLDDMAGDGEPRVHQQAHFCRPSGYDRPV